MGTSIDIFGLAVKNHQKNNLKEALNLYSQVLKIKPDHTGALNNLGIIFKELSENQKAKSCYEKAIRINPSYADAHNNLGIIFNELGENQKAKSCYEKAIIINPSYADAHYNLGSTFEELGENQKSKSCYEKAIVINPNYADAHNNLGVIYYELGDYQKAKSCYEKAIEINPIYASAYNNFGALYQELGQIQKAKSCYEKSIKIDPGFNAHNNLGLIYSELGDFKKAISCYEKSIKINPNYEGAYNNLGALYQESGQNQNAISCYEKSIEIDPKHINFLNNLSCLLKTFTYDNKTEANKDNLKKFLLTLFRNNNISHQNIVEHVKLLLFTANEQNQLRKVINSDTLLENQALLSSLKEELFYLMLQKSIVSDKFLEKLLTQFRYEILLNLENFNKINLTEHFNLIMSLAEQCWLNEYVYTQSKIEIDKISKLKNKIESNNKINELEIATLGTYIPLNSSEIIINKLLDYKSSNVLFNDLINVQIKEPLKEKEIIKSIRSLDIIDDDVSKKVRKQYEENPYPRWKFTHKYLPHNFFKCLNREIEPNRVDYNNQINNPNVLIAGCGTGNHSIQATKYKNSNILAVDLSLTSLAYAKRKTEELGYKNIEYLHADILQLNRLNKKFDIVESVGTLHHMKNPITGLKILLDMLEPHGFLKLGLYSETARQNVVKAREAIKERNYKNTTKDIKHFRQDILDEKVNPLIQNVSVFTDFYSTSMVRDLLFHIQEHRFTIPQISKILNDLDLEFLGFSTTPLIKKKFSELFPNDKKNISLDNWHKFEIDNPFTFLTMYQFYIRRK